MRAYLIENEIMSIPQISRYNEIGLHLDDILIEINWLVYNIDH